MSSAASASLQKILAQPAYLAAPSLLGCILTSAIDGKVVSGVISEVEAYDQTDPASHTFRGMSARNRSMFQKPGTVYVYFTYGMHYCMNIATDKQGFGSGVLLRSIQPLTGIEHMWQRRYGDELPLAPSAVKLRQLTDGPAKLTQALGVDRRYDGIDIFDPSSPIRIDIPEERKSLAIVQTPRIGISQAKGTPWRWYIRHEAA